MTARSTAFRLLVDCLSLDHRAERVAALQHAIGSANLDWHTVLQVANEAKVSVAVLSALQAKGLDGALPPDIRDFFDGVATLNRLRNKTVRTEALELARFLNAIGVVPVFLKGGAHLLCDLYDDPGARLMVDLDVLIPADRLQDAADALRGKGYDIISGIDFAGHHHYPPLGRPGTAASVELHTEVLDFRYQRILRPADVLETAIVMECDGARLAVPSPTARVIHAIAHAQLSDHDYLYGHLSLRDLLDFALLAHRFADDVDWHEIAQRFATFHAGTALAFHLVAADRLLDRPIDRPLPGMPRGGGIARTLYRRALWQLDHPTYLTLSTTVLRPVLLFVRSLSHRTLRRRLVRSLTDGTWYSRQWQMLRRPLHRAPARGE